MKILVTGAAGFIGFSLCRRLLEDGHEVTGIDNMNTYYDVSLKRARIDILNKSRGFSFETLDISDKPACSALFKKNEFDTVVNLAAQAGVRYSLVNPDAYIQSNIAGFTNIIEECRHAKTKHLVYASTSSVYGLNKELPFSTDQKTDRPASLYAATKKANELIAHSYSHLFGLPSTGLRFFTVYGPWGRPDMALFLFTKNILEGRPVEIFNNGRHKRDFTYIDDIVDGLARVIFKGPLLDEQTGLPYKIYNIGSNRQIELLKYIELIESNLGKKADRLMKPKQPGDIDETYADVSSFMKDYGYKPSTSIETGVAEFIKWYTGFYGDKHE